MGIESKSLCSGTAETSVCKGYVLCPDENCDERIRINSDDEVADCKFCGTMSNLSCLELFPIPNSEDLSRPDADIIDTENEIEPKSSYSGTAEKSVCKGYVICPDEDCDERIMINSDDEVAD